MNCILSSFTYEKTWIFNRLQKHNLIFKFRRILFENFRFHFKPFFNCLKRSFYALFFSHFTMPSVKT